MPLQVFPTSDFTAAFGPSRYTAPTMAHPADTPRPMTPPRASTGSQPHIRSEQARQGFDSSVRPTLASPFLLAHSLTCGDAEPVTPVREGTYRVGELEPIIQRPERHEPA